jgi:hypothetical protein
LKTIKSQLLICRSSVIFRSICELTFSKTSSRTLSRVRFKPSLKSRKSGSAVPPTPLAVTT